MSSVTDVDPKVASLLRSYMDAMSRRDAVARIAILQQVSAMMGPAKDAHTALLRSLDQMQEAAEQCVARTALASDGNDAIAV